MNIKNIFSLLITFLFINSVTGQDISKGVEARLKAIKSVVTLTKAEEKKIRAAAEKLIYSDKEIRSAKREHMQLELRENSHRYLSEILFVLDDERYDKWRASYRKDNDE